MSLKLMLKAILNEDEKIRIINKAKDWSYLTFTKLVADLNFEKLLLN
jgi:hypothetical protein